MGQLTDYVNPLSELKSYAEISFKSEEMANLFIKGLKNAGFRESLIKGLIVEDSFYRDGSKIVLYWSDIYHDGLSHSQPVAESNNNTVCGFFDSIIETITICIIKFSSLFTF